MLRRKNIWHYSDVGGGAAPEILIPNIYISREYAGYPSDNRITISVDKYSKLSIGVIRTVGDATTGGGVYITCYKNGASVSLGNAVAGKIYDISDYDTMNINIKLHTNGLIGGWDLTNIRIYK